MAVACSLSAGPSLVRLSSTWGLAVDYWSRCWGRCWSTVGASLEPLGVAAGAIAGAAGACCTKVPSTSVLWMAGSQRKRSAIISDHTDEKQKPTVDECFQWVSVGLEGSASGRGGASSPSPSPLLNSNLNMFFYVYLDTSGCSKHQQTLNFSGPLTANRRPRQFCLMVLW